jgi:4-hydroxy-tetrahydrodipicolinate synthase
MPELLFRGAGTALVTPFTPDGSLDTPTLRRLLERQIAGGVDMLIPCGTTGEAVTLGADEYETVVGTAVDVAAGRLPVIAGAGSNDTRRSIDTARIARSCGADAVLVVGPYYNKPTQEGFFRHFRAIAEAVPLPMIIYNVPGRTGSNMSADTQLRIAGIDGVAGTKEASGNFSQVMRILQRRPAGFSVLSGDDAVTLPLIAAGADGVISVVANELPDRFAAMVHAAMAGDLATARAMHYELLDLMEVNFIESSPIPVKAAMAMMGLLQEAYRLPMVPPTDAGRAAIRAVLDRMGLLAGG